MPTITIYHYADSTIELNTLIPELKELAAKELTCGEITLQSTEMSVRIVSVSGEMIGDVEIEIHAHAFDERVQRQDEICTIIRSFVMEQRPHLRDVRVWLVLSQLGHSW